MAIDLSVSSGDYLKLKKLKQLYNEKPVSYDIKIGRKGLAKVVDSCSKDFRGRNDILKLNNISLGNANFTKCPANTYEGSLTVKPIIYGTPIYSNPIYWKKNDALRARYYKSCACYIMNKIKLTKQDGSQILFNGNVKE
jgi:hypothetical protein